MRDEQPATESHASLRPVLEAETYDTDLAAAL
eukprot:COSAG02_NODE_56552_length_285_cov_0.586022_2_plen_31_part_01